MNKQTQRTVLALMTRNVPVTYCPPAPRPQAYTAHTGKVIPFAGQFTDAYLASIGAMIGHNLIDLDDYDHETDVPLAVSKGARARAEQEFEDERLNPAHWAL